MIEVRGLTKRYGRVLAVDALSFDVRPGVVTGFLGPNGSGKFSLGMAQRLGIAAALLGDPGVLLFDEPVNGLDPEGIRWIRDLMKSLAAEGGMVFVSSHLINEMAVTADRLIVIGAGRLLADTTVAEMSAWSASLEDAFLKLTSGSAEFRGTQGRTS